MALKENYKDDILDVSVNTKRKYRMTENQDGTVSFDDETVYTQEGDSFGASDLNTMAHAINNVSSDAEHTSYDNTTSGLISDNVQGAIDEINDNLSELIKYQFGNVVDIKSYTYANPFVCPCDGYIWLASGYEASKYTIAKLNNTVSVFAIGNTGTGGVTTCFVKKGMTVGINTNSGNDCQAKFYPLA